MPARKKIEVGEEIKKVTKKVTDMISETGSKKVEVKMPWAGHTGDVPLFLDYFDGTMYDKIENIANQYPNSIAFDFMGRHTTYRKFMENIHIVAKSLKTIGVRKGDCVTIAMPNCPQAIYSFYAINLIGGIANMIHPLSAEKEIEFYLNESNSVTAITLDQFYHKFENIRKNTKVVNIIIASIKDELSKPIKAGYMLTDGYKIKRIPKDAPVIRWKQFIKLSRCCFYNYKVDRKSNDPAVILYSGGTTGTTKGIVLTNKNFNSLAAQIVATNPMFRPGDKMLAAMPLFHGFGLGVCVHSMLANGGRCILIPRFTPKSYAKDLVKYKCNFVAGVPTLFEALLRLPSMEKANLSSLKGVFSGGDSLSIELKKKLDKFLADHKANIQVREGYGTTETVTACCLTPVNFAKEGSIGVPFPDTYIKIVKPGTDKELPYGKEGEILLAGPTVMKEYWKHPEETANTLRKHKDGKTWVYTGDLGIMDEEGFIYFKGRAKRMIITSGYNVYPSQIENILEAHPAVQMSCVIGVPDSYKMEKVKAFVTLKPDIEPSQEIKDSIMTHCRKNIAKYAMPYDIEFRKDMPKTLVGKVAYRKLEEEELNKIKQQAQQ
ncbi:MAG: AMP-binding protein [Firmicutes bacterium]|nr:AMP-binding protein [Candidatus Colivicinus equi]